MQVAGGLGERLGYDGIKLALPVEVRHVYMLLQPRRHISPKRCFVRIVVGKKTFCMGALWVAGADAPVPGRQMYLTFGAIGGLRRT